MEVGRCQLGERFEIEKKGLNVWRKWKREGKSKASESGTARERVRKRENGQERDGGRVRQHCERNVAWVRVWKAYGVKNSRRLSLFFSYTHALFLSASSFPWQSWKLCHDPLKISLFSDWSHIDFLDMIEFVSGLPTKGGGLREQLVGLEQSLAPWPQSAGLLEQIILEKVRFKIFPSRLARTESSCWF